MVVELLEVRVHDDLLLVCVLEWLAPLDRMGQSLTAVIIVVVRNAVGARCDGRAPLDSRNVASQD